MCFGLQLFKYSVEKSLQTIETIAHSKAMIESTILSIASSDAHVSCHGHDN